MWVMDLSARNLGDKRPQYLILFYEEHYPLASMKITREPEIYKWQKDTTTKPHITQF